MSESKKSSGLFDDRSFGFAVNKASNRFRDAAAERRLAQVVDSLGRASSESKGTLGYLGRRFRKQFAGFLVANRDRERISATAGAYSELSEEQATLLSDGHATLQAVIGTVAPRVAPGIPDPESVLTCYRNSGELPSGESMLTVDDIVPLTEALQRTEPGRFLAALHLANAEPNAAEVMTVAVEELERRIVAAGVSGAPEDLIEMVVPQPVSPVVITFRIIVAVMRIRAMLRNACQLMFQVSTGQPPSVLDEDNIFGFHGPTSTHIGDGYSVDCQPTRQQLTLEPGDLILVNYPPVSVKQLCHMEHGTLNFSRELGTSQSLKLRGLSTDLDPYSRLRVTEE